jgi:hypothetical protein
MSWARNPEEHVARRAAEKQRNLDSLALPARGLHKGVYAANDDVRAAPKSEPKRNSALLQMAEKRPCLLRVPGVCNGFPETTVACHSNFAEHGKAGARKADDCYSVWGCAACHKWLDQPIGHRGPTYEEKRGRFMLAHDDQVIEWRRVAADSTEPERFRKAALWALEQLNAGPLLDAIAAVGRAVL